MSLHRRVRKLEGHSRVESGLLPCPSCGGPREWRTWKPAPGEMTIRVLHPPDEPTGPGQCPACGRQLVLRLVHERAG